MNQKPLIAPRQLFGLIGLIGTLLFFFGDMLFYGYWGSGASFTEGMLNTVQQASLTRLYLGGLVGPIAACLCIVGFWHVYLNTRDQAASVSKVIFAAFFTLMVTGSAVHTLWTTKGLALKYCTGQAAPCSDLLVAIRAYWLGAYYLSAVPGYLGSLLLAILVLMKKSRYPRWTIIFNPAITLLLEPVAFYMPSPIGAIMVGGFTNLAIALFFLISVLTTWSD